MFSPCQKFLGTSKRLVALREEFTRSYDMALAMRDVPLAKKLIDLFQVRMKELGKEYPQKGEFVLRGFMETKAHFPSGPAGELVFPDPEVWKKRADQSLGYQFDVVLTRTTRGVRGYYQGRFLSEFAVGRETLRKIGILDKKEQIRLMEQCKRQEAEPIGKIFDLGEALQKKRDRENNPRINSLTTKEVLEAIDEAGYRPATLIELLAYAKYHWKPEPERPTDKLTEKEKEQRADTEYIYALGSPFVYEGDCRAFPFLKYELSQRELTGEMSDIYWKMVDHFLVFRK